MKWIGFLIAVLVSTASVSTAAADDDTILYEDEQTWVGLPKDTQGTWPPEILAQRFNDDVTLMIGCHFGKELHAYVTFAPSPSHPKSPHYVTAIFDGGAPLNHRASPWVYEDGHLMMWFETDHMREVKKRPGRFLNPLLEASTVALSLPGQAAPYNLDLTGFRPWIIEVATRCGHTLTAD